MIRRSGAGDVSDRGRKRARSALQVAVVVALLATLFDLAPAFGAAVQDLSAPGQSAGSAQVAVDSKGNAFVVWERSDGSHTRVQLRRRSASGALGSTRTLSAAGQGAGSPQVAVDGAGNTFVVWARYDGAHWRIQLRRRSASGILGAVQTLSSAAQDAGSPDLAVDSQGRAIVAWQWWDGSDVRVQLRRRAPSGNLGPIQTLSAGGQDAEFPQAAVDAAGNAIVVWQRSDGANTRIQSRRRSASGSLGPVQTLSAAGQDAEHPHIGIDAKGNAYVVWDRHDGADRRIQLRRRATSGSLGSVRTLSGAGQDASRPQVAVDGKGNAIVVWEGLDGTNSRIRLRRRSASGNLGPVQTLSAAGQNAEHQQIALDGKGNAIVVWERSDGSHRRIQSRRRSVSGVLGLIRTLSEAGQNADTAQAAVAAKGIGYVVWGRHDGADWRIQGKGVSAS